ncbi:MAG: hypothetical protein GY910_09925 [bacterium]|nr:hypothetical protein [bacterium]
MMNRKRLHGLLLVLLVFPVFGCAVGVDRDLAEAAANAMEEEAPLGGEALAQRRMDLDRAWRDLLHFDVTVESMVDRRDGRSVAFLDAFLDEYMGRHLDSLLRPMWQSSHPEVMALDANLRFMKAELLSQMRYTRRVQASIDDIEMRFRGRESMLVEYPVGFQRSLGEALEMLRNRKWAS